MNIFRTTESVHPRKIFCLLLEQTPVWTDDVSTNHSLTEESHQEGIVMENIERLKRRACYSIEFPHSMEKSMAPDDQLTLPPSIPTFLWSGIDVLLTLRYPGRKKCSGAVRSRGEDALFPGKEVDPRTQ